MSDFDGADTLRNFVTDQAAFEKIIDCYEKKEKGEKIFVFEVTMQNYGGYNKKSDDFSSEVDLTDLPDKTRKVKAAQNYLTLIGKSDQAFQMLTEYFAEQEEPTIILMFGDHQPSDYVTDTFADLNEGLQKRENNWAIRFHIFCGLIMIWIRMHREKSVLITLGGCLWKKLAENRRPISAC